MKDAIVKFFLETVGKEGCVFLCSMIPIIELRGAIPLGATLGLAWWQSYLIAVIGNMVPVPFILLFIRKIIELMSRSKLKLFNKIAGWLNGIAVKRRSKVERFSFWGLALFIGIPLPMTGAWSGSLVAATIRMNFLKAILSALIGVMMAGAIMTLGSYGVVTAFKLFL